MAVKNENGVFHLDDIRRHRLIETIERIMKEKNFTPTQLAKYCNLQQPTIHRLLSGQTNDPRLSTLLQIAEHLDITLDELIGKRVFVSNKLAVRNVPVLSWKEAITANDIMVKLNHNEWVNWVTTDIALSEKAYALYSKSCMEPRFPKNSLLFVEPDLDVRDGDFVIVAFKNADEVAVREFATDGPKKAFKPLMGNPDDAILFNPKEHEIEGVIVQIKYDLARK
ncbi:MAG: helix-turn-helix domain-containing protein [Legionellales bacterium]|nr:helix-turn-helix domain-containing protein [Legionellales bacterium]